MHPTKSNRFVGYKLMLTAILLLVCVLLLVGATLARYQTNEFSYLGYAAQGKGSVSLQTNGGWSFTGESGTLSFSVSNSTDEGGYAPADQSVSVRLLASLSIAELGGETVQLVIADGTGISVYTATPAAIAEGTALYKTFGAGRVYLFRDADGKELSWTLAGGTPSVLSAELRITGLQKPENPALLQLQVVGG